MIQIISLKDFLSDIRTKRDDCSSQQELKH